MSSRPSAPTADQATAGSPVRQVPLVLTALIGLVTILAIMALPLRSGQVHTQDDLGWLHLPVRVFYADCLARGEAFDWMPGLFSGFYLSGSGDAAGYHPLHWLLYRWLPLPVAFEIELLVNYPLLFCGTFLWLWRIGLRRDVALVGSLFFTLTSFSLLHFIHPNMVGSLAHLPWLLAVIDLAVCAPQPARRCWAGLAIVLLTGSQILLAHPQTVWLSLLVEAGYTVFLLGQRRKNENIAGWRGVVRTIAGLTAAKVLGFLLGAIQILPMFDAMSLSVRRTATPDFVNGFSLFPLNLLQLIAPYLFKDRVLLYNTHEFGLYVGAVPLLLIAWLPGRLKTLGSLRSFVWPAIGLATVGILLSFGPLGLIYSLQGFLPLVRGFRCPCRYLMFAELAASLLAALSWGLLLGRLQHGERAAWRELAPLGGVFLGSVVVAVVGLLLRPVSLVGWVFASPYEILAGPLLFGSAALLFALAARGWTVGLVGLISFTAVDLGAYGLSYIVPPWNIARSERYLTPCPERPAAADAGGVADDRPAQGRVFVNDIPPAITGGTRVDGYAQLMPARRLDYLRLETLQVAAVDWVRQNTKNASIPALREGPQGWLLVPDPLPRVRLAARAQASRDPANDLGTVDWRRTVLTDEPIELLDGTAGTACVTDEGPGRFAVSIDASAPRILAVAESYHPGWQAHVDGRPATVLRVNGDFLGCLVGPGRQQVVLEFRPHSLRVGRALSLAAVVLSCLWAVYAGFGFRHTRLGGAGRGCVWPPEGEQEQQQAGDKPVIVAEGLGAEQEQGKHRGRHREKEGP
ncbi:MAG: YfhO family protein [Planctomycetota bacterium]|nr:YfhO family protein [Planctomycetota bacterium]